MQKLNNPFLSLEHSHSTTVTTAPLRSRPARYGITLATVLCALLVTVIIDPLFANSPFLIFMAAITFSAWYGGFGPGLLASLLTVLLVNLYLIPAESAILETADLARLLVFMAIAVFVSTLYRAQSQLRQQQDWLRIIFNSIGDGVIVIDARNQIILLNPVAERLTGWTQAEAQGLPLTRVYQVMQEETGDPISQPLRRKIHNNSLTGIRRHILLTTRDGIQIPVSDSGAPIYSTDGSQIGSVVVFRDITEQYAFEKLREEELTYVRSIVDALHEALLVLDHDLRVQRASPFFYDMFQLKPQAVIGQPIFELADGVFEIPALRDLIDQALQQGKEIRSYELSYDFPRIGQRTMLLNIQRFYAPGQTRPYSLLAIQDITERKAIEEAERQQRQLAETLRDTAEALNKPLALDEVLDEMLSIMARIVPHDAATILLIDEGEIYNARTRGFEPAIQRELDAVRYPVDDHPMVRRFMAERQPLIVDDFRPHSRIQAVQQSEIKALLSVPILCENEMIGALSISSETRAFFNSEHATRLQAFAAQSAIAIQNAYLYQRAQEAAAIEERNRLARELHDAVTQTLFTSSTIAQAMVRTWEKEPAKAADYATQLQVLNQSALAEMRLLLNEMRPEQLTRADLADNLQYLVEAFRGQQPIQADLQVDGDTDTLSSEVRVAFYRITQEALNNINKHAHASQVTVHLEVCPDQVKLAVRDNGNGFDPAADHAGIGMHSMRERAEGVGARLEVRSQPGSGTRIIVTLDRMQASGESAA